MSGSGLAFQVTTGTFEESSVTCTPLGATGGTLTFTLDWVLAGPPPRSTTFSWALKVIVYTPLRFAVCVRSQVYLRLLDPEVAEATCVVPSEMEAARLPMLQPRSGQLASTWTVIWLAGRLPGS